MTQAVAQNNPPIAKRLGVAFQVTHKPRMRLVKDMDGKNSVRAYRDTPETICVQIRHETRYSTVSLTFDEAREYARQILAAVDD